MSRITGRSPSDAEPSGSPTLRSPGVESIPGELTTPTPAPRRRNGNSLEVIIADMSLVAEYSIETEAFPLGSIFRTYPDATVELERVVPTGSKLVPYFWVRGVERADIADAFDDHPAVASIRTVDELDGESLYRVEWGRAGYELFDAITESEVSLLSGVGTSRGWTLEIRSPSAAAITRFQSRCREHGVSIDLTRYHELVPRDVEEGAALTEAQREALLLAYERGYYRSPRETTLEEMASELGITGQSLGSRLQRGIHRLIGTTLVG